MREILFRGKTDNGEWIEGLLEWWPDFEDVQITQNKKPPKGGSYTQYVIPETVGQYTGLTDKNGTKIFEGDIIQYYGTYPLEVFTEEGHTKIRWFDSVTKSKCSELFFGGNDEAYGEFEVIGNIHDNPELLEVSNNEQRRF